MSGTADKLLTPEQAAEHLGVAIQTLASWRCTKRYAIPHVKVGRLVRYREADITAFVASRLHSPTDVSAS